VNTPKGYHSEQNKRVTSFEARFGREKASPVHWLEDFERRRDELFEALFKLVQDDLHQCNEFIDAAKVNADKLLERCVCSRAGAKWTLDSPQKTYEERIREHKEACLRHIALQDLVILDLREHEVSQGVRLPQFKILPPGRNDKGLPWLVNSLTQAHEHVTTVGLLVKRDQGRGSRRAGSIAKSSKLLDKDYEGIIRPLVKSLLLNEPHWQRAFSKSELEQCYCQRIMALWKDHPYFAFDEEKIKEVIGYVVAEQDIAAATKKSPFERRRRPPSMKKPDRLSNFVKREANACEQWQMGVASGLEVVLENRFGELGEKERKRIAEASPEELKVWLCRACSASGLDDVF
jgi:hypothetical protein